MRTTAPRAFFELIDGHGFEETYHLLTLDQYLPRDSSVFCAEYKLV